MAAGKIIGIVVVLIVALMCFPMVNDAVSDISSPPLVESFTAVENSSTIEPCTLTQIPIATSIAIDVNGVALVAGDWIPVGKVVSLDAATSDTGDAIVINYNYAKTLTNGMSTVLPLIPVFYLLLVLGIVIVGVRKVF